VELIGLYLVACGLLVVAGVAKALRPDDTARAMAAALPLRTRTARRLVRVGSVAEAALGITALVLPRPWWAALVALSYAVFAGFVAYARSTGGAIASCGCFGTPDTPATLVHAVVNVVLALSAVALAVSAPEGTVVTVLAHQPGHGVPLVAVSALAGWLAYLAISVLAGLQAARALAGVTFDRPGTAS
jgi:Methylamine utilisation protein MauE